MTIVHVQTVDGGEFSAMFVAAPHETRFVGADRGLGAGCGPGAC